MEKARDSPFKHPFFLTLTAYWLIGLILGITVVPEANWQCWLLGILHVLLIVGVVVATSFRPLPIWGCLLTVGAGVGGILGKGWEFSPSLGEIALESFWGTCLVGGMIGGGQLVAHLIKEKEMLVPIGVLAAIVDPLGVYWGFTREVTERIPERMITFCSTLPVVFPPEAFFVSVGPGDILFMAIFFYGLYKFSLNIKGAVFWCALGLSALVSLLFFVPVGKYGIPGLPFIALTTLLPSARYFSFTAQQKHSLKIAAVLLVPLLAAIIYITRQLPAWLQWR